MKKETRAKDGWRASTVSESLEFLLEGISFSQPGTRRRTDDVSTADQCGTTVNKSKTGSDICETSV